MSDNEVVVNCDPLYPSPFWKMVGQDVGIEFDMESYDWPIPGYPAWGHVVSVDMPLIELRPRWGGNGFWINSKFIKRIWLHG